MPSYDVQCGTCQMEDEVFHKMSEPHPVCRHCGNDDLATLILTVPPINFKGKGWTNPDFETSGKLNRDGKQSKLERQLREEVNAEDGIYSDKVV